MLSVCTLQVIPADTQSYIGVTTLIDIVQPAVVLLNRKQIDGPLGIRVKEYLEAVGLQDTEMHAVHPKFFQEVAGLETIESFSVSELHGEELSRHSLALEAVHALHHFLQSAHSVHFQVRTIRYTFQSPHSRLSLPLAAIRALEVLPIAGQSSMSLLASVNRCSTKEGARLLRSTLIAPLKDLPTIEARQVAVQELFMDKPLLLRLAVLLKQLPDQDSALSMLVTRPKTATPSSVRHLVHALMGLKMGLEIMAELSSALATAHSPLLVAVRECMQAVQLQRILEIILAIIDEEATVQKETWLRQQEEVFAVRAGQDAVLDTTRVVFAQTLEDIDSLAESYQQNWGTPSLTTKYSRSRGYHLSLPAPQTTLPDAAVRVTKLKRSYVFTTQDLEAQNRSLSSLLFDMYLATNAALQTARGEVLQYMWSLSAAIESVALLDMVQSFAQIASQSEQRWTRPEFVESYRATLQFTAMRHPVAEALALDQVANDCDLGREASTVIVTGPNGSGKSTFIRTVAVNAILAHCGAFVPAQQASLSLLNDIFVRVGFDDDMHTNASTFTVEMRELAHILSHASPHSLVIIDELGRGTAVDEGVSIAWAAVEELLQSSCACLLVTHFHELTGISDLYSQCAHLAMAAQPVGDSISFEFKASDPQHTTFISDYGIRAARAMGCPDAVLETAVRVKAQLMERKGWSQGVMPNKCQLDSLGSLWATAATFAEPHAARECPIIQWVAAQASIDAATGCSEAVLRAVADSIAVMEHATGPVQCLQSHIHEIQAGLAISQMHVTPVPNAADSGQHVVPLPDSSQVALPPRHKTVNQQQTQTGARANDTGESTSVLGFASDRDTVVSGFGWDLETELSSIGDLKQSRQGAYGSSSSLHDSSRSAEVSAADSLMQLFGGT